MVTGIANAPAASSLDALWAKLQQQHSLEAEAARMSRKGNSSTLAAHSTVIAEHVHQPAVVPVSTRPHVASSSAAGQTKVTDASLAPAVPAELQQQSSEADFWKSMQK